LAVQIHGSSRGAAGWIQPHCSSHTGWVRVVKTQHGPLSEIGNYNGVRGV